MLLSKDGPAFIPAVSKSCRFNSQQRIQITQVQLRLHTRRRPTLTAQSRAPCHLLGLSRDKLSPLDLSRLFRVISSIVLSKLNRHANQRSVSRLEINEY